MNRDANKTSPIVARLGPGRALGRRPRPRPWVVDHDPRREGGGTTQGGKAGFKLRLSKLKEKRKDSLAPSPTRPSKLGFSQVIVDIYSYNDYSIFTESFMSRYAHQIRSKNLQEKIEQIKSESIKNSLSQLLKAIKND